jgi:hypothetical protein
LIDHKEVKIEPQEDNLLENFKLEMEEYKIIDNSVALMNGSKNVQDADCLIENPRVQIVNSIPARPSAAPFLYLGSNLSCLHCLKAFNTLAELKQHVGVHQTYQFKQIWKCSLCKNLHFEYFFDLKFHHYYAHKNIKKDVSCNQCNRLFYTEELRDKHEALEHPLFHFPCLNCSRKFPTIEQLKCHNSLDGECHDKTIESRCHICKSFFRHPHLLRLHQIIGHLVSKRKCSKCDQHFTTLNFLLNHLDFCGKVTISDVEKSGPARTVIKIVNKRPLAIEEPKRKIPEPLFNKLPKHIQVPGGSITELIIPDYQVDESVTESPLITIEIPDTTVTDENANWIYMCLICKERFEKYQDLESHTLFQTNHLKHCGICSQFFLNLTDLERHQKELHTTSEPNREYPMKKLLNDHIARYHTKPKNCICRKEITSQFALYCHIKAHINCSFMAGYCRLCTTPIPGSMQLDHFTKNHNFCRIICFLCEQPLKNFTDSPYKQLDHHYKKYSCKRCNALFCQEKMMLEHQKSCPFCLPRLYKTRKNFI